jgi:hypothetical protein
MAKFGPFDCIGQHWRINRGFANNASRLPRTRDATELKWPENEIIGLIRRASIGIAGCSAIK